MLSENKFQTVLVLSQKKVEEKFQFQHSEQAYITKKQFLFIIIISMRFSLYRSDENNFPEDFPGFRESLWTKFLSEI